VNHGCIVATNPLSAEGWAKFLPGEMKVLQKGSIALSIRASREEGANIEKPTPNAPRIVTTTAESTKTPRNEKLATKG
jgi:hypothetical protein